ESSTCRGACSRGFGQAGQRPLRRPLADASLFGYVSPRTALRTQGSDPVGIYDDSRTTNAFAPRLGCCQATTDPSTYELPLELRNAGKNTEYKASVCSAGIHAFVQGYEIDLQRPKFIECIHQLSQAPCEPVIPVNNDGIHHSLPTCRHELV